MEASALSAGAQPRRPLTPLLRLRSDDQLIALFRAGSEEAFSVIHDRYRQRLFAYVRQMLATGPRADAEDVLQDVFVRAYGSLRAGDRSVNLKAWLYRVAHNRCIDQLRRPAPAAADILQLGRTPLLDPIETAQRRDDLRRLVADVARLPEQQRSALLMREIDGLAYADIAAALEVSVAAVKSLLVRARIGLVEAIEARDTDCAVIRADLAAAYERGVKASGRARRHMRECDACTDYRTALRGVRRSFAALTPTAGAGPAALLAKLAGASGVGGGTAAGVGLMSGAAACKVAVVVCGTIAAGGGAVELDRVVRHPAPHRSAARPAPAHVPRVAATASPAATAVAAVPVPAAAPVVVRPHHQTLRAATIPHAAPPPPATPVPKTTPVPVPTVEAIVPSPTPAVVEAPPAASTSQDPPPADAPPPPQ